MFLNIIIDFFIYTFSFLLFYFIQNKALVLNRTYLLYYLAFMISWVFASLISRKFFKKDSKFLLDNVYPYFISFFVMLGILITLIIIFDLLEISRFVVISSLLLSFTIELCYITLTAKTNIQFNFTKFKPTLIKNTYIFEFFIYALLVLYISLSKLNISGFDYKNTLLLISLYFSWFVASLFSHHFNPDLIKKNYWYFIWQYFKSFIILISLNTFIAFGLHLNNAEINIIVFTTLGYIAVSFIIVTSFFFFKKPDLSLDYRIKYIRANELKDFKSIEPIFANGQYKLEKIKSDGHSIFEKLKNIYLKKFPEVFEFLNTNIDLNTVDTSYSVVLRARDIYNVEILPDESLEFFFNLLEANNIRRLNRYFIEVNKKLIYGGILIGRFQTISSRHKKFITEYPYFLGQIFYFFDFVLHRVFPKIPVLQKFYFTLTKGYNRAISFAEGLGRLYYCGFEVINIKEIYHFVYFIAKKVKEPFNDSNPSYGPLFKMRRIGYYGKQIYVYKLRTMHPYAEYLQNFVFKKFNLQEGGKFNNDFRITYWGKVLRKMWIDELPMIFNFVKGELKIVGVRPLSKHYFELYPDDLKELRIKTKPGLIPPFYYDLPKSFEDILESERKYLKSYFENPLKTDIKYFFKAAQNIIIKHARSS